MLLLTEILDPKFGMFTYIEESKTIWFNDTVCSSSVNVNVNVNVYVIGHSPLGLFRINVNKQ